MSESFAAIEAPQQEAAREVGQRIRQHLYNEARVARAGLVPRPATPQQALARNGCLADVLTDLERIAERSPDPDSRMWARGVIHHLARMWEPDEEVGDD